MNRVPARPRSGCCVHLTRRLGPAVLVSFLAACQQVPANIGQSRGSVQISSDSDSTQLASQATLSANVKWEADIFGRICAGTEAARARLDTATLESDGLEGSPISRIAETVVDWRACDFVLWTRQRDIASRESTMALVRARVAAGMSAEGDEAQSLSELASARTDSVTQYSACRRDVHARIALSGLRADAVRSALSVPPQAGPTACSLAGRGLDRCVMDDLPRDQPIVPAAPRVALAVPAVVLASQPNVLAARRRASAAWSDINQARASRYPRLGPAAVLTEQWLQIGGQTLNLATWTGATTLLVFEDARRRYGSAQGDAISAAQDRAQPWIFLIRTTGNQGVAALAAPTQD